MTTRFLDLSDKIDPVRIEILHLVSKISMEMNIPFFVVGATARDIFFEHTHNIKTRRATIDLDLGIHIAAWDAYYALMDRLLGTAFFVKSNIPHRIFYSKNHYPVDIVPFGAISSDNGVITWPDNQQMSTKGFEDAFRNCYRIKLHTESDQAINVASPEGLVVMKLISWEESTHRSEKDAQDLELIFSNYHYLFDNCDRVFDSPEVMNIAEFDLQRAGTILLGRDTAAIFHATLISDLSISFGSALRDGAKGSSSASGLTILEEVTELTSSNEIRVDINNSTKSRCFVGIYVSKLDSAGISHYSPWRVYTDTTGTPLQISTTPGVRVQRNLMLVHLQ